MLSRKQAPRFKNKRTQASREVKDMWYIQENF